MYRVHLMMFEQEGTSCTVNILRTVLRDVSIICNFLTVNTEINTALVKEKVGGLVTFIVVLCLFYFVTKP